MANIARLMPSGSRRSRLVQRVALVAAIAVVAAAFGCQKVTPDSIETWKTTQRGPEKLLDALKDKGVPANLRGLASAALVDLGRADEVDRVIEGLSAGERWDILKTLVPIHVASLKDPSAVQKAREAKDALFSVRHHAPPDEQRQIDAALLPAIEADLRAGRFAGARHSPEKMLAAMGPQAGPMLAKLLGEPISSPYGVAELLAKVGDAAARERGAINLTRRAAREGEIPQATWKAIGLLGGKAGTEWIMMKAEKSPPKDAIRATQALQQSREPSVLAFALRMAGAPATHPEVRQEMFGVVEKVGGLAARDGLVRIIAADKDERVRYLAYETALASAKTEAIIPSLEAFPAGATYKKEDVIDFLVKDIEKIGKSSVPKLVEALTSGAALARMTAVLALEKLGGRAEAAAVSKLAGDKGSVKGFPGGVTVGKEASRVAALLETKT